MKYYFNIVIFIIQCKIMSFKIFDSFQSSQLNDTGDLIDIKDYHNLSIAISTSKNIYWIPSCIKKQYIRGYRYNKFWYNNK